MGLFDFFKKKTVQTRSPEEYKPTASGQELPPLPSLPPPIPATINEVKKDDRTIESENKGTDKHEPKYRLLKNFFSVDITSIKPEDGETRLFLDNPELGMFRYIEFHQINDGSVNLEFLSLSKKFSKETLAFIESCTKTFGPTRQGEGTITPRDQQLLMKGLFSRMWRDIWLDCRTDSDTGLKALSLTIFNVDKTANFIMNE